MAILGYIGLCVLVYILVYIHYFIYYKQATCTSLGSTAGWAYAVRRPCHGRITCATICANPALKTQDPQVARRRLII